MTRQTKQKLIILATLLGVSIIFLAYFGLKDNKEQTTTIQDTQKPSVQTNRIESSVEKPKYSRTQVQAKYEQQPSEKFSANDEYDEYTNEYPESQEEEPFSDSIYTTESLEHMITELKRERKSAITIREQLFNTIQKYWSREDALHGRKTYLKLMGYEEDSPERAEVLRELSETSQKVEQLHQQRKELRKIIDEIDQELTQLKTVEVK